MMLENATFVFLISQYLHIRELPNIMKSDLFCSSFLQYLEGMGFKPEKVAFSCQMMSVKFTSAILHDT